MTPKSPNLIEKSECCSKCYSIGNKTCPLNFNCPCHLPQPSTPNYIESVLKEFDEQSSGKITDHSFDGSCLYNNNENGKGHKECRYPFNPEIENPQGKQCLKLQKEHFDFKSFLSTALEKQQKQFIEKIEGMKKPVEPPTYYDENQKEDYNMNTLGWNSAIKDIISLLKE